MTVLRTSHIELFNRFTDEALAKWSMKSIVTSGFNESMVVSVTVHYVTVERDIFLRVTMDPRDYYCITDNDKDTAAAQINDISCHDLFGLGKEEMFLPFSYVCGGE